VGDAVEPHIMPTEGTPQGADAKLKLAS
jgi:hypothetical protein